MKDIHKHLRLGIHVSTDGKEIVVRIENELTNKHGPMNHRTKALSYNVECA